MTRLISVSPDQTLRSIDPVCADEITSLGKDDVLYFVDFFKKSMLEQIIAKCGKPLCVITTVEGSSDSLPVPCYYIPVFGFEIHMIDFNNTVVFDNDNIGVTECFNFSIGKQRPERHLLLKLIEWFNLTSHRYSWSEHKREFNMSYFIEEMSRVDAPWMTNDLKIHMLGPIQQFERRWVYNPTPVSATNLDTIFVGGTVKFWWDNIHKDLVPQTATTLITESVTDFESNFTFTEKTLFAIAGLTFPIWVGSHKQADQAARMGIDTFGDIVNHSYQYCDTMFERCYRAISDNIELLTNLELAQQLKSQQYARLVKNRDFVFKGGFSNWIDQQFAMLPPSIVNHYTSNYKRNVK